VPRVDSVIGLVLAQVMRTGVPSSMRS
jgi:hypothetical protein